MLRQTLLAAAGRPNNADHGVDDTSSPPVRAGQGQALPAGSALDDLRRVAALGGGGSAMMSPPPGGGAGSLLGAGGLSMLRGTLSSLDATLARARSKQLAPDELAAALARREAALAVAKARAARDWQPEYVPPSLLPEAGGGQQRRGGRALLHKAARVSSAMLLKDVPLARKTKIVCTLGPACWSEEGLGALLDAGMDVARFNFSHGDHAGHLEVLQRLRKVTAAKGVSAPACALDTKGPEIRTAMLRGGQDIELTEGQEVELVAVGADYASWEGYVDDATGRAVVGLSYARLCEFVRPSHTVLLSDGTITLRVIEALDEKRLLARAQNTHKLGQRKNVNLVGVVVDLPVLGEKDIADVRFAAQQGFDYVFASFVQSGDDVRFVRAVLDEAGGARVQVIAKIESSAGLSNVDDILAVADGVMVARGDLAMEIEPQKVALAQKLIVHRCLCAGKPSVTATQMMESMIAQRTPTRAELSDVANAVFDGTSAVMLSGETANGAHPALVVKTMAEIVTNAEAAVDHPAAYHAVRAANAGAAPIAPAEAVLAGVVTQALGFCADRDGDGTIELGEGCLIVVCTSDGAAARLVAKYRPPCPVLAVSDSGEALRSLAAQYAVRPLLVPELGADPGPALAKALQYAQAQGLLCDGMKVIQVFGASPNHGDASADDAPRVTVANHGLRANSFIAKREAPRYVSPFAGNTTYIRCAVDVGRGLMAADASAAAAAAAAKVQAAGAAAVAPNGNGAAAEPQQQQQHHPLALAPPGRRACRIIATLGPASWTPAGMAGLLAAGVTVARINAKHQTVAENQLLIDMWRMAAAEAWEATRAEHDLGGLLAEEDSAPVGIMISIRGHEVRSARLSTPGTTPLPVAAGETLEFVGVGDDFLTWRGGRPAGGAAGPVRVGLSYLRVGEAVAPGDVVQLDDGELRVRVTHVLSPTAVRGVALNAHAVREMALVHLPGAFSGGGPMTLGARDLEDLALAAANRVAYVSVPFVRSAADVKQIRAILDGAGGPSVRVVAQIDCAEAVGRFDEILEAADAVMVSRTNLAMALASPAKVPLAQKWLVQKARLAAKPVLVAGQVMEGMAESPRPSRPAITDVVNAVYDGADGLVLMQETSCGEFGAVCARTVAAIIADAEAGLDAHTNMAFLRNFTPKPIASIAAAAGSAVQALIDMRAAVLVVLTDTTSPVRLAASVRSGAPLLVLTREPHVAAACSLIAGVVPLVLGPAQGLGGDKTELVRLAVRLCRALGPAWGLPVFDAGDDHGDQLVLFSGPTGANDPFLNAGNFNTAEVCALVFGSEARDHVAPKPSGHRGRFTISMRSTKVGLDLVTAPVDTPRKTKIVCTLGPACWSEEGLGALLDAGMDVARLNFSHGDHAGHLEVLQRLRKVAAARGDGSSGSSPGSSSSSGSHVAVLLDTKGPEIRTSALRGGKPLALAAGQKVELVAVGADYTSWEGYVDDATGVAVIGLSYPHLARDVSPGGKVLLADGSVTVVVDEVLADQKRVRGTCLNAKVLGERKNVNLPGVMVDLPVLGEKDVDDVVNFGVKHGVDFVAASFVQSGDDVRFIRRVLDDAGGRHIQIIAKIESHHGVVNFDDILAEADGIMVARGDLAMEVPSEKVALAQKMMVTKANVAGRFVVTATQMLESMTAAPLPTRAEMTDVANAVFDGTDAVMLSGETASGAWPALAASTMAAIVTNAEVGVNSYQAYQFIRDATDRPMATREAVLATVAKSVVDTDAGLVVLMASARDDLAASLAYVRFVAKYRPRAPTVLLTKDAALARACGPYFGVRPVVRADLPRTSSPMELELLLEEVVLRAVRDGLCPPGRQVVCALQTHQPALAAVAGAQAGAASSAAAAAAGAFAAAAGAAAAVVVAEEVPVLRLKVAPGKLGAQVPSRGGAGAGGGGSSLAPPPLPPLPGAAGAAAAGNGADYWRKTLSLRSMAIALDDILKPNDSTARKTKIVCTLGPACWSEEGLGALLDAGMDVARLNFSHGDHAGHLAVLRRLRRVAAAKGANVAVLLDTKGPEIRTAMLRGGKTLDLSKDQQVELVAVGADYTSWEGGLNPDTGVVEIGISYDKLASSVRKGSIIKVADGTLSVRVDETFPAQRRVRGTCLNAKGLGQTKNVNLPGVHVDIPVLTDKDVDDLVNFGVRHGVDFVAASFVQSGDDVRFIRQVLDRSGGRDVQVVAKIENEAGLARLDDILAVADGVMVARGDLAMEVPSEKVALAQKMMVTKANVAGRFVVTATQMLESMTAAPLPTRAEMTDVANAVFDGTDAVMLSGETASGAWPALAASTMAAIVTNAEVANSYYSSANFMIDHTLKPFSRLEAAAAAVCGAVCDADAQLVVVLSATGEMARLVSKYRPFVPQVVVTASPKVVRLACARFGQYGLLVGAGGEEEEEGEGCGRAALDDAEQLAVQAAEWAEERGLWCGLGAVLLISGRYEANADMQPALSVFEVSAEEEAEAVVVSRGGAASGSGSRRFSRVLSRRPSLPRQSSASLAAGAGPAAAGGADAPPPLPIQRQFSKGV